MSKELEALSEIKNELDGIYGCPPRYPEELKEHIETVEQALKRNEPMKRIIYKQTFEEPYSGFYQATLCPNCKEKGFITNLEGFEDYCPICGQALEKNND